MKVIFSPCLYYCKSNELYDLFLLNDTLDFLVEYLDSELDDYVEAFYNEFNLFVPPIINNTTEYIQYLSITTNLYKLKTNGSDIILNSLNNYYELNSKDFNVTNNKEFQIIIDYLNQLLSENNFKDILLFYGENNDGYKKDFIEISLKDTIYKLPVVGNTLLDESGNFDSYITSNIGHEYDIFKSRDICIKLVEKMNQNRSAGTNGSLYKYYGKIIALRNRFKLYYPKRPYERDTYYFISFDKQYIISIDLKHGHFEVFDNTDRQLWIAKYSFSGEVINKPTDPKTLKDIRKTHKVEAD